MQDSLGIGLRSEHTKMGSTEEPRESISSLETSDTGAIIQNTFASDDELHLDVELSEEFSAQDSIEDLHHLHQVSLAWNEINVLANLPQPPLYRRIFKKKSKEKPVQKHILFDVRGEVKPGTLLAVMGASGAGKTTLMNVLAHRNIKELDVSGSVTVNNKIIGRRIKRFSAYVQQEDLFMGTLTVREHLMFQAILRIDKSIPISEKKERVEVALSELGLRKCENSLIGTPGRIRGISGGEQRRLSFASELLTNPSLLFVDEPTSGLDSFMALNVVAALRGLAKSGRTVLATIHQPSSEVFAKFDSILLMSEGRVAYMGPTKKCGEFFKRCGYDMPINYNPSDFYIKTLAIMPSNEEACRKRALAICSQFHSEQQTSRQRSPSNISFAEDQKIEHRKYKVGFASQFKTVLRRSFTRIRRDPGMNYIRIAIRVILGLVIGLVYLQQKNTQKSIQNINGVLFFMSLGTAMSTYGHSLLTLSSELPMFLKEHRIAMYRVDVYFFCNMLAEFPLSVLAQMLQNIIVYWMTGLRVDAAAFFIFCGVTILISQASLAYAYAVSTLVPNLKILASVGNLFIFPLVIFGGFFVNVRAIPSFLNWLKYLSFIKYGFEALAINQWESVTHIPCPVNSTVPCIPNGNAVLESNGFSPDNFHMDIYLLVVLLVSFRILAYLFLFVRAWRR